MVTNSMVAIPDDLVFTTIWVERTCKMFVFAVVLYNLRISDTGKLYWLQFQTRCKELGDTNVQMWSNYLIIFGKIPRLCFVMNDWVCRILNIY